MIVVLVEMLVVEVGWLLVAAIAELAIILVLLLEMAVVVADVVVVPGADKTRFYEQAEINVLSQYSQISADQIAYV